MSTWRLGERESCVSVLKSYFQVMLSTVYSVSSWECDSSAARYEGLQCYAEAIWLLSVSCFKN